MESLPTYSFSLRELKRLNGSFVRGTRKKITFPETIFNGVNGRVLPDQMRQLLKVNGYSFKKRSIAHLNMRGGIGKTTASISLATRAAQYGFKTCLIDLDPQASATYSLVGTLDPEHLVMADIWQNPQAVHESIIKIDPALHLFPSSLDNSVLDDEWDQPEIQKRIIKEFLEVLKKSGYDLILFDAPPSLSPIVISIIAAIDQIIVPVWSDPFSLRGLELIEREVMEISKAFGRRKPLLSILYAHYDARTGISETIYRSVKKSWPEQLLKTRIRSSSEFSKAIHQQESVFRQSLKSSATTDYDQYTREVLDIPLPSPFTP